MGNAAFALSLFGLPTLGLLSICGFIVGAIAMRKSHRAGYNNGFAKWAMWLSCVPVIGWSFIIVSIVGAFISGGYSELL
jgi:uncharacterized membrane protein SpoIIM required for sporulation